LSGRQGLEWALGKNYDLVLTDVRMPDMGGMLILRDIKEAKPSLPVIIITGMPMCKRRCRAMKLVLPNTLKAVYTGSNFSRR